MNYKDKCRTCLGNEKDMRNVNSSVKIGGDNVHLIDILQNFYGYKITEDPSLPQNICINCVHQLTITYSFKILIESSYKQFTEVLHNEINSETFDCHYFDSNDEKPLIIQHQRKKDKKKRIIESIEESPTLFCVECKAEYHSPNSLIEHCVNSHPVKSEIGKDCEYCNEKFDDYRSLVLHRKLHLRPYVCENCWEGFYNETELNSHSCQPNRDKEKNKSIEKTLSQCDHCGKSYPQSYIKVHILTHSQDRRYSCKLCPKKFKVPGSLNSHVLWNHKRTRNHKCEVCNATFISSSAKSSHVRKNHLKEKKYRCDNCGKRFFAKSELQRHSLTHTGVKNFHCHLCDKSYQTRYGLNVHLKSHSQITMNVMNL